MVIFPLLSTIFAFFCTWTIGRDAIRRPRADKVIWTIAFLMFGLAAGADAAGNELGWAPWLAKLYYATGPALVVMFLAIGELYLVIPARMRRIGPGLTFILTAFWLSLVLSAPIDSSRLAAEGWEAIHRDTFMVVTTILINTVSTLVIVGGTAYSIWNFRRKGIMRNRMIGCTWILVGTLFVAAGGSLTRLGHYEYLYVAMSIGIAMIYYGLLYTRHPDGSPYRPWIGLGDRLTRTGMPAARRRAMAYMTSLLDATPEEISRLCAEWSVPLDAEPALSRGDARVVWAFRMMLPAERQARFDALPVPVRRQVALLYHHVLAWPEEPARDAMPRPIREVPAASQVASAP